MLSGQGHWTAAGSAWVVGPGEGDEPSCDKMEMQNDRSLLSKIESMTDELDPANVGPCPPNEKPAGLICFLGQDDANPDGSGNL